jgi:hypothetical protein
VSAVLVTLVCYHLVHPAGEGFGGESHQQDELSPQHKVALFAGQKVELLLVKK